jgi:hypothetical protein
MDQAASAAAGDILGDHLDALTLQALFDEGGGITPDKAARAVLAQSRVLVGDGASGETPS